MVAVCDSSETNRLLRRASGQDPQALADLFAHHRERLRRMVRLRLDWRLRPRFDSLSVLNEVYAEASRRFGEYAAQPPVKFYLWLRQLAAQTIQALHREHLGAQMWNAGQEVSLYRGALPQANSVSLAAQLLGQRNLAGQAAARTDLQVRLQEALNNMEPMDRELLALRHFEELNNDEAAAALNIDPAEASIKFVRALKRLKEILKTIPGFFDRPHR
jgi:RNA polymerase sigma-70 factor (ECF subfamily)